MKITLLFIDSSVASY